MDEAEADHHDVEAGGDHHVHDDEARADYDDDEARADDHDDGQSRPRLDVRLRRPDRRSFWTDGCPR